MVAPGIIIHYLCIFIMPILDDCLLTQESLVQWHRLGTAQLQGLYSHTLSY